MRQRSGMIGVPRVAAAITSGVVPAIVAFVVLMVIDGDWAASLVTALIIWAALSAVMYARFGRPVQAGRKRRRT